MSDQSDYDPELTEHLLAEGDRRLDESRRLLEELEGSEPDDRGGADRDRS